jgi:glycerol uptake facilitator-like aquaporin
MRVDTTPAQVPAGVRGEVANFISEADAREIVWLHNFKYPPWRALWKYFAIGLTGGLVGGILGATVVQVFLL